MARRVRATQGSDEEAVISELILVQNFFEELKGAGAQLTRQIPWLRVFVEGVDSVRGVSLQSVSGLSAATLGEQFLGEVRLIPQSL